jgi:hypothetical protein
MPEGDPTPPGQEASGLAPSLAPALAEACEGRLGDLRWFGSTWQRGGASTAYSTYDDPERGAVEVVVKVPVGPVEHRFTTALSGQGPTPRVLAGGSTLAGYDLAWLVIEKLDGPVLSEDVTKTTFIELTRAAAAYHKIAGEIATELPRPKTTDWEALVARARESVKQNAIPEEQRWNQAIKGVQKALPAMLRVWRARPVDTWCHGDLHPGNAIWEETPVELNGDDPTPVTGEVGDAAASPPTRRAILIDLAETHPGCWVEDGVYLERLFWGRSDALKGAKPVKLLAKARKALGLDNGEDHARLANVRRVMLAACVPAFLEREGHPKYLHGALETLEGLLPTVQAAV